MHVIYEKTVNKKRSEEKIKKEESTSNISIVTQNDKEEIMQIIYFDFDDSKLSEVSESVLISFLNKNKNNLSRYIILGHTDTKGSKAYNLSLSLKRAKVIKQILISEGINEKNVSILGKGEEETAVSTPDETKHPANRRAEVKIMN
jgi:outer membrane protein OmpA-like peptidoglycan-associated protein